MLCINNARSDNARSVQANFDKIELCVIQINATVDIVAVSEINGNHLYFIKLTLCLK